MLRRSRTLTGRHSVITISYGRGGQGALRRNAGLVAVIAGLAIAALTFLFWG